MVCRLRTLVFVRIECHFEARSQIVGGLGGAHPIESRALPRCVQCARFVRSACSLLCAAVCLTRGFLLACCSAAALPQMSDPADLSDLSSSSGVAGSGVVGDASSSGSSAPAPAAPLDPQLLAQLSAHLIATVPNMLQGNANVFSQHVGTAEAQVRGHTRHRDTHTQTRQERH